MLGSMTRGIRSLLFPPTCAGCVRPLESPDQEPLCTDCRNGLPAAQSPSCVRCGLSLAHQGAGITLCLACRTQPPPFDRAVSPFVYDGPAKELILGLKYRGRLSLSRFLTEAMVDSILETIGPAAAEVVVPVPLHPTRLRERTFNQAQILAAGVAGQLGLPCRSDLLVRVRATEPQTGLRREERWENLRDAFALSCEGLPAKSFLLVDDVFTTGATVRACAAALKRGGASHVFVVTAARG